MSRVVWITNVAKKGPEDEGKYTDTVQEHSIPNWLSVSQRDRGTPAACVYEREPQRAEAFVKGAEGGRVPPPPVEARRRKSD